MAQQQQQPLQGISFPTPNGDESVPTSPQEQYYRQHMQRSGGVGVAGGGEEEELLPEHRLNHDRVLDYLEREFLKMDSMYERGEMSAFGRCCLPAHTHIYIYKYPITY